MRLSDPGCRGNATKTAPARPLNEKISRGDYTYFKAGAEGDEPGHAEKTSCQGGSKKRGDLVLTQPASAPPDRWLGQADAKGPLRVATNGREKKPRKGGEGDRREDLCLKAAI